MGGGAVTRADAAGGISAGARGVGAGMRGAGGCDEGIDGGGVCDGAAGAGGFTSAGVFAAAGRTGFGLVGAIGTEAGVIGEGSCDFCSGCGSGFFSGMGNDIGAGSLTGTDKSTCGFGTGVSLTVGAVGVAGRCVNSLATGPAGWTAALSWRLRSATSRWKEVCCLEFSSVSWSKFSRSFLYFPSRTRVIKGVAIARIAKSTKISSTRGMGVLGVHDPLF